LIGGSYNEERMISYLGYQDFGDYPEETMVGSISTIDEEDIDWLMVDGTEYGDGDSVSTDDDDGDGSDGSGGGAGGGGSGGGFGGGGGP